MILKRFLILFIALTLGTVACDDGLEELNVNPNVANSETINYDYIFTYAQLRASGGRYENWRASLIYQSTMMQHFATVAGYWSGDKYTYNAGYSSSLFDRAYNETIKDLVNLKILTEGKPEFNNLHQMTRIFTVYNFHRLTDLYGDVPYSEAGKGFLENNFSPAYDPQSAIYPDMLNELEQATAALDLGGSSPSSADIMFNGDVSKWQKWGYSLMLRLGMRLSKVDPAAAQAWVQKAIAGGVMESNDDIALIQHSSGPEGINRNGIGEVFFYNASSKSFTNEDSPRLSTTMIDWLKEHNDPRLSKVAVIFERDADGNVTGFNSDPEAQKGLPNGFDATTIQDYEGGDDLETYSRVNPLMVLLETPMFLQSYAEIEFLLAEAALQGWGASDAAGHYEAGVRAAMKQLGIFDASLEVADADIDAYLSANPFDEATGKSQLGWQYWMATFLNEYETFSNWRRTGYPDLTPTNYPGNETNGQIPRRLRYSIGEYSVNAASIQAANANQGPDLFMTRVWWDAE